LKKSAILGTSLAIVSYGLLPLVGKTLPFAFGGLFMLFVAFEFSIVCCMSLYTELLTEYRATMMSFFFATAGIGRVIGAFLGGIGWVMGGIMVSCLISVVLCLLGLLFLIWGLVSWQPEN